MIAKNRLKSMYNGRTLVFGHRGAMAYAPMNTLQAFELAYEQGADGIEFDVHRTKDGQLAIVHDFTVDETTDGTGNVTEMTLPQLKELDAGSWFSDEFRNARIPTLEETIETVGQKLFLNIEIKSMPPQDNGVEALIAECIQHHAIQDRVFVSSFNPLALKRFKKLLPDVPIGYLYMPGNLTEIHAWMSDTDHEAHHPYYKQIDADYMQWAKKHDYIVNTWTVNDLDKAKELRDLGVNGIITNTPDKVIETLKA